MKAREVMAVLRISRSTLNRLRWEEKIVAHRLPNGYYEYEDQSVYDYLLKTTGRAVKRKTVLYARVSTRKQKRDLENQIEFLKQFCVNNGWVIDGIYRDVASALDFDHRKDFNDLIHEILNYRIARVVITYQDRLTRTGFGFFDNLFRAYGTEIVVINNYLNEKSSSEELMEEIFTLLHSFSMKFDSRRRQIRQCLGDVLR
ncbi:MAG: IS607 family transposase [Firmicutes bacterium]|nr:IS607 family transposase [Bacillota bacterium]